MREEQRRAKTWFTAVTRVEGDFVGESVVSCACQLLGLLADRAQEALHQDGRFLDEPAVAAVELIRNRDMKQEDQAVPVAQTDTDLEAVVQQGIVDDVGVETESPPAQGGDRYRLGCGTC